MISNAVHMQLHFVAEESSKATSPIWLHLLQVPQLPCPPTYQYLCGQITWEMTWLGLGRAVVPGRTSRRLEHRHQVSEPAPPAQRLCTHCIWALLTDVGQARARHGSALPPTLQTTTMPWITANTHPNYWKTHFLTILFHWRKYRRAYFTGCTLTICLERGITWAWLSFRLFGKENHYMFYQPWIEHPVQSLNQTIKNTSSSYFQGFHCQ